MNMLFSLLKVVSFPRVVKVADVVSILRSNEHNGFPVSIAKFFFFLIYSLSLKVVLLSP